MEKYLQKNGTVECGLDVKGVQISNLLTALQLKRRQTKGLENIKIERKKKTNIWSMKWSIFYVYLLFRVVF